MISLENIFIIEYCTAWGYLEKAVGLANEVLSKYKNLIYKLELVPSTGGVFEITLNQEIIFSKKDLNRYPKDGEILNKLEEKL